MLYLTSVNDTVAPDGAVLDTLLARIGQGDRAALAALYDKTKASVYGFALSIVKDPHDAEDVLQSLYIAVWDHAAGYVSQGKPLAWLLTITRNLCYQRWREDSRTTPLPEDVERDTRFADSIAPEDRLLLEYCLQQLSDEERQILTLHAVAGFKHRQIARLLELPLGTVLSKYNRAIKKLREHFKGGEHDD